jgi:protein SCO1
MRWVATAVLTIVGSAELPATSTAAPPAVSSIDVAERLGAPISLDGALRGEQGEPTSLREIAAGDKPILLILGYYGCPMLCGLVLRGVASGLAGMSGLSADAYQVVVVSFDPNDTPATARRTRRTLLQYANRPEWEQRWRFLTGSEPAVRRIADQLGFTYVHDAATGEYAHPAVVFALTADGRISRYLYGIEYRPADLRLALVEAGEGRVGRLVDRIILTCYRYDPATRRYGPYIQGFFRLGAIAIFLVVGAFMAALVWRDRRRQRGQRQ